MQLNNDGCSRGEGEGERRGKEKVNYHQIWKMNFSMEAKTQEKELTLGVDRRRHCEKLQFAEEIDGKRLL